MIIGSSAIKYHFLDFPREPKEINNSDSACTAKQGVKKADG